MHLDRTAPATDVHRLVLERLYHEDLLLTQRTYNYLTFNVFLAAAAAFTGVSRDSLGLFGGLIVVVGAVVSVLQGSLGRRIEKAITFWREYARSIEEAERIPVDHLLFAFYRDGRVQTPWGAIGKREQERRAMYKTWPWSWMPSTNTMIGVLLPFLIATVWLLAAFIPLLRSGECWLPAAIAAVWLYILITTWVWPLPATPERESRHAPP